MLEFYDYDDRTGYVSIYNNYLILNKKLANFVSDAYKIRLGIDVEKNKIYLFKVSKDKVCDDNLDEKSLLKLTITKSYGRISSRDMIEFIVAKFKLDIPKNGYLKFKAKYLLDDNAIAIMLKEEI